MRTGRDLQLRMTLLTAVLIGVLGLGVSVLNTNHNASDIPRTALAQHFQQAVAALQAKRFAQAEQTLHELLQQAPRLPEAHVNMGYAQLGLGRAKVAADFFTAAIELRSTQVNAYYGLAVALERSGDLRGALGAMRSYVHLTQADDPYLPKARAALWEWETQIAQTGADKKITP